MHKQEHETHYGLSSSCPLILGAWELGVTERPSRLSGRRAELSSPPTATIAQLPTSTAAMSSHGHSHDHGGHSHAEHSHSHSHDGVACAGHEAIPPTEAELAAQKQERLAFDRGVASFYHYEPHSVRPCSYPR